MTELPDWSSLEFGYYPTDVIYRAEGDSEAKPAWGEGQLLQQQELTLPAAAGVLSYGCSIIEGLKAERSADGRLLLFRPADYAARFHRSAERLSMLPFPPDRFVEAVRAVVDANRRFVPPPGRGSFYLRPVEYLAEPMLGLRRGQRFAVVVYGSPVCHIVPRNRAGLAFQVARFGRVAARGTGSAKAAGNYAGTLAHREAARAAGFDDVLYLDAEGGGLVQETSGSNVFVRRRDGTLVTPAVGDTILPGITRDSAMQLARSLGVSVEERPLPLEEVLQEGIEAFCTGTAYGVCSIAGLGIDGSQHRFHETELARSIRKALRGIQSGNREDTFGWTLELEGSGN